MVLIVAVVSLEVLELFTRQPTPLSWSEIQRLEWTPAGWPMCRKASVEWRGGCVLARVLAPGLFEAMATGAHMVVARGAWLGA